MPDKFKADHEIVEEPLMPGRKLSQHLCQHLSGFAFRQGEDARQKASRLPPGAEKDELVRKVRQADTAVHLSDCAKLARPAAA